MFRARKLLYILLPTTIFASPLTPADNLADPMRPPSVRHAPGTNAKAPRWEVTAILVSAGRRLAMVNNRLLGVGATVDGARIKAIYGNAVELDVGQDRALVIRPAVPSVRRTQ